MPHTYAGDQNEHFENLINTLASIEAELHQKYYTPMRFCRKKAKNNKSLGRDP